MCRRESFFFLFSPSMRALGGGGKPLLSSFSILFFFLFLLSFLLSSFFLFLAQRKFSVVRKLLCASLPHARGRNLFSLSLATYSLSSSSSATSTFCPASSLALSFLCPSFLHLLPSPSHHLSCDINDFHCARIFLSSSLVCAHKHVRGWRRRKFLPSHFSLLILSLSMCVLLQLFLSLLHLPPPLPLEPLTSMPLLHACAREGEISSPPLPLFSHSPSLS